MTGFKDSMKFQIFGTKKGVCNINVSFLKNGRKERRTMLARNLLPPVKKPGNEMVVRAYFCGGPLFPKKC